MIRKVRREEIPACADLIRRSFLTVADAYGITEENAPRFTAFATTDERLYRQLDEGRHMFVYEEDGILCGFYSLLLQDDHECELSNLAVLPEYRHRGIGEKLLEHAFETARQLDRHMVNIGIVEENQPLRRWYEAHGAVHVGTKKFDFFPFTSGYLKKELRLAGADRNSPELVTDRLILRKFTPDDLEALHLILSDEEVNVFLPWFPMKCLDETKTFYESRYAEKYRQPRAYAYALCLKEDNIPIGYIAVDTKEPYELGYGLRKEFWDRGIMTEAVKAVIAKVREDGIPYITATHDAKNPRSGRVMQKAGMKYCYSYHEFWQPKGIPTVFRMYQLNLSVDESFVCKVYWDRFEEHFIEEGLS